MKRNLLNIALFQVGWFACVLGAAYEISWIGASIALLVIGFHVSQADDVRQEMSLILLAMVIGLVWDSFLVWQQWISYSSGMMLSYMAPYWIVIMWGLFATTLNVSLRWLKQKIWVAILFGALAGPLAYVAGNRLGALEFSQYSYAITALAIGWAIFTPLLLRLSHYFDGYRAQTLRGVA